MGVVCWVHFILSFLNGVIHIQYIVFVMLQAISIKSSKMVTLKKINVKFDVYVVGYELMRPRFEHMLDDLRQKNPRATAWLDNIPK
ncbi:hypothetical protein Lal_00046377 [Lupinus albus]|nr:hypothetical protein Lal_00046377 [Lupinus albus]